MKKLFDRYIRKNIMVILVLSIIIYSIYFSKINTIYVVDPYKYIKQAKEFSFFPLSNDILHRGLPFILYLKVFFDILGNFINTITILKIAMGILVVCFYFFYYNIIKVQFNEKIAFVSSLLIFFEISFNTYAIMPYFELFSFLFGFAAIFFIYRFIKTNNQLFLLVSIILSIISSFTRMEMYIIVTFPILVSILLIIYSKNNLKKFIILIFAILVIGIFLYPILCAYYYSMTRFNPLERIYMGLRWDIISNAVNSIFCFTENNIFNYFLMVAFFLGFLFYIISLKSEIRDFFKKKSISITKSIIPIIMVLSVIAITFFIHGYSYKITGSEITIFPVTIGLRFLILSRILVIPIFILFLEKSILLFLSSIKKIYLKIRKKQKMREYHKNWKIIFTFCLLLLILLPYLENGWNILLISDYLPMNSEYMATYQRTAKWLEKNVNENEYVLVPFSFIFEYNLEKYKENLISYEVIWDDINVNPLKLDLTQEEKIEARDHLINFIENNKSIKYVVIDWIDPYIRSIYKADNGKLFENLILIHEEKVTIGTYRPSIKIFKPIDLTQYLSDKYNNSEISNSKVLVKYNDVNITENGILINVSKDLDQNSIPKIFFQFNHYLSDNEFIKSINITADVNFSNPEVINLNNEEIFQLNLYFDINNDGIFNYADNDIVKSFSVANETALIYPNYLSSKLIMYAIRVNSNHFNQNYYILISRFDFFIAAIRI